MHSSLLLSSSGIRIMIDCGADWLGQLGTISPDAIVITHAHIDHAFGLNDGAPCAVYATADTWRALGGMPIDQREVVCPRQTFEVGPAAFEAIPVIHSAIAPAVGYRVTVDGASFFYVPDVLQIPGSAKVLNEVDLYIGDGARLKHSLIRGKGSRASGHASIREQLSWCADAKVGSAIFTHCGTPIIKADSLSIGERLTAVAQPFGIEARFAFDGQEIIVGRGRT